MLIGAFIAMGVAAAGVAVGAWCAYGAHLAKTQARVAANDNRRLIAALAVHRKALAMILDGGEAQRIARDALGEDGAAS